MIVIAGTIRTVSRTGIGIPRIFIIKMYKKLHRVAHSQHLLTASTIAVESKCLFWRKKHRFINITISSAAIISPGIAIIVPIWNWILFSINVPTVFVIPVYVASIEATWTAAAIPCNAVFASWPCILTGATESFCTVVDSEVSAKPNTNV